MSRGVGGGRFVHTTNSFFGDAYLYTADVLSLVTQETLQRKEIIENSIFLHGNILFI